MLTDRRQTCCDLICPDFETLQTILPECSRDRDVGGVPASRNEYSTNPWHIISGIKCVPGTTQKHFYPRCEVSHAIGRKSSHVAEVSSAVSCRDIHTAAERNGEMRVIAAHARTFVERLPRCSRWPRSLIIEGDMVVHEIADCLNSRPSWRGLAELRPCRVRQEIGLAVPAAQ